MIFNDYSTAMTARIEAHKAREAENAADTRSAREKALESAIGSMRDLSGLMRTTNQMAAARQLEARRKHGEVISPEEADQLMADAKELDDAA